MATTLPGSPYVESSDLVANYPAVSEALAERVDLVGVLPFADAAARTTALPTPTDGQYSYLQDTNSTEVYNGAAWVAAGTAPGLVHINTTTFSAASSISLNNVFTSNYDNYLIKLKISATTVFPFINARLRLSGTDATGANYNYVSGFFYSTVSSDLNASASTNGLLFQVEENQLNFSDINIFSPFLVDKTFATSYTAIGRTGIGQLRLSSFNHTLSTSYDGITFYPSAGVITGTVRIFGYKNS